MSARLPRRERAEARELTAVVLVYAALRRTATTRALSRVEAVQILTEIRATVKNHRCSAAVASVVNDALLSCRFDRTIECRRVVDPLLDIRIALTRPDARAELVELGAFA